jgi:hypothetical protein
MVLIRTAPFTPIAFIREFVVAIPQAEHVPMRHEIRRKWNGETDSGETLFANGESENPPTPEEVYFEIGVLLFIPLLAALIFEILLSGA